MPKETTSLAAQSLAAAAAWEDTVAEPRAFGRATSTGSFSTQGPAAIPPRPSFPVPMPESFGYPDEESTAHIQLGDDFFGTGPTPPGGFHPVSGQPRKFAAMWGFVALGLAVVLALAVWQWMVVPAIEVPATRGIPSVTVGTLPEQHSPAASAESVPPVVPVPVQTASPPVVSATPSSSLNAASLPAVKSPTSPFSGVNNDSATTVVNLSQAASAVPANELTSKVPLTVIEPPVEIKHEARSVVAAAAKVTSPRQQCGARTEFALYRCMQTQCVQAQWSKHPQCLTLKATDEVAQ
jgi:hypothetical protein